MFLISYSGMGIIALFIRSHNSGDNGAVQSNIKKLVSITIQSISSCQVINIERIRLLNLDLCTKCKCFATICLVS